MHLSENLWYVKSDFGFVHNKVKLKKKIALENVKPVFNEYLKLKIYIIQTTT